MDIETFNEHLSDIHIENAVNGIQMGNNVSCPIVCPNQSITAGAVVFENINFAASGTTGINLSNTQGAVGNVVILGARESSGSSWTNILTDAMNSCTDTDDRIGFYELNSATQVQNSSVTDGVSSNNCAPTPTLHYINQPSAAARFGSVTSEGSINLNNGAGTTHDFLSQCGSGCMTLTNASSAEASSLIFGQNNNATPAFCFSALVTSVCDGSGGQAASFSSPLYTLSTPGTAPTVSSNAGTGALTDGGDNGGIITVGSTSTATTLTFGVGWGTWASCSVAASTSTALPYVSSISGSAVTFTYVTTGTPKLYYWCTGH
jgi:hypothetical protein